MTRTFEALGIPIVVAWDDTAPFAELAEFLVSGYAATSDPPALSYSLVESRVTRAGFARELEDPVDVVPVFELDLYQRVVELAPPGWVLHAAALEVDGRVFVFAGQSGAGKTTLTLALAEQGARILTEEIVHIAADGQVRGLARPIHLGDRAPPLTWRHCLYPIRTSDGSVEQTIAAPDAYLTGARPLDGLFHISHGPTLVPVVEPLPAPRAIAQLWDCTLRQNDDAMATAITVLRRNSAASLQSDSVAAALTLVRDASVR